MTAPTNLPAAGRGGPTSASRPTGTSAGPASGAGRGGRLATDVVTGAIAGLLVTLLAISLGGLVFAGPLAPHAGTGIGLALFTGVVSLLVITRWTSMPGALGTVQDVTAAVLAVVAAGIVVEMGGDHPALVGTVIAAIALTSASTGVVFWLLGRLQLGQLVRFLPYPVIGGFLAGTGWLLFSGGLSLLTGEGAALTEAALWRDATAIAPVLSGVAIGLILLFGTRLGAGTDFIPAVAVGAIGLFYAVVLSGPGVPAARANGWLLGPFPDGRLWPPDPGLFAVVEFGAIGSQAGSILTVVVLASVAMLLNASGIELSTQQDADLDRELRVTGWANLAAAAGGGLPGFHALSFSELAHRAGATRRLTGLTAAVIVAVTLMFSGDLVALAPRPIVGGLLVFIGLTFLTEWIVDGWTRMRRTDHAVVVLIVVMIATVGFLEGVAVGLLVTVALFVISYSRTDIVRHVLGGDTYPSHLERSSDDTARIAELAPSITILELQGFLFFGTANRLVVDVGKRLDDAHRPLRFLVVDFRRVAGLDSSTVISFQKAAQRVARHDATIVLSGLRGRVAEQVRRSGLHELPGVHIEDDLDHAVQWCEDALLATASDPEAADARTTPLREQLAVSFGDAGLADGLLGYLERKEVEAGVTIIAQGERTRDLYFLESGRITISLTDADGERHRLRTMLAGTVIGEVAMYLEVPRSAAAVADTDCVLSRLGASELERMEREDPEVASALHRLLAGHLASRLASVLRTIEALGR